jgi:hypothetical protein
MMVAVWVSFVGVVAVLACAIFRTGLRRQHLHF